MVDITLHHTSGLLSTAPLQEELEQARTAPASAHASRPRKGGGTTRGSSGGFLLVLASPWLLHEVGAHAVINGFSRRLEGRLGLALLGMQAPHVSSSCHMEPLFFV